MDNGKRSMSMVGKYTTIDLHATEKGLEEEIRREYYTPGRRIEKYRRAGANLLHSKMVLLIIVVLNLLDCGLVLCELILDIHYVKELRGETETTTNDFISVMQTRYPSHLKGQYSIDNIELFYNKLYKSECQWPENTNQSISGSDITGSSNNTGNGNSEPRSARVLRSIVKSEGISKMGNSYKQGNERRYQRYRRDITVKELEKSEHYHEEQDEEYNILEDLAHAFHKASIIILGILFIENIVKLICNGKHFFRRKLEVFDFIVVIVSFAVDLVLLKGLTHLPVQEALFILSFLLPWRVIRVLNSLIVAVLDQEHFRLKMIYKEKKLVDEQLLIFKDLEKRWDFHLKKVESFCESEGIPKWRIRQHTAMGRKQSTISTMASLALSGALHGICLGPDDKTWLDKKFDRSASETSNNDSHLDPSHLDPNHANGFCFPVASNPTDDAAADHIPANTNPVRRSISAYLEETIVSGIPNGTVNGDCLASQYSEEKNDAVKDTNKDNSDAGKDNRTCQQNGDVKHAFADDTRHAVLATVDLTKDATHCNTTGHYNSSTNDAGNIKQYHVSNSANKNISSAESNEMDVTTTGNSANNKHTSGNITGADTNVSYCSKKTTIMIRNHRKPSLVRQDSVDSDGLDSRESLDSHPRTPSSDSSDANSSQSNSQCSDASHTGSRNSNCESNVEYSDTSHSVSTDSSQSLSTSPDASTESSESKSRQSVAPHTHSIALYTTDETNSVL